MQTQILALLHDAGIAVADLAVEVGVSPVTLQAGLAGVGRLDEGAWSTIEQLLGLQPGQAPRPVLVSEFEANGLSVNRN